MRNTRLHNDDNATGDLVGLMLPKFMDSLEIGLYVSDFHTGELLFVNRKAASFSNHTSDELIGKRCWDYFNKDGNGRCPFCPYQKLIDDKGNPLESYVWEFFFESLNLWIKSMSQAIMWPDGRLAHMVIFYDITEVKKTQERLENLAFIDPLLQIKNGYKLEQKMDEAGVVPSIVIIDILSLQKVNDAYGRLMGDNLLKAVRDWILEQNIPNSELYRIGGDEFCLCIPHADADQIKVITDTILGRFVEPWIFEDNGGNVQIFLAVSIGVILSNYVHDGESLLNLIDRTLKTAKSTGKTIVYDEAMDREFKKRLAMEMSLKKSVRENMAGFEVHYQPITTSDGRWIGLESLCRWNSAEFGPISPLLFIPEAERLSLIGEIGIWIIETAIANCKKLGLDKVPCFNLNINVSAVQFSDETLAPKILEILRKNDFPSERLCLEITESTQFTFSELSLHTINLLRGNGILVALDDFGTGYSNFSNLKNLPVDIVKIERDFVSDIEDNNYHQYLFRAMTELAHTAGKKLVAEGVESKEQVKILLESGADFLQGYLFGKPMPPDELESRVGLFLNISI